MVILLAVWPNFRCLQCCAGIEYAEIFKCPRALS